MNGDFLFLAPTLPCPRFSGLSQRAYHLIRALSEYGRVHVCYLDRRLIRSPMRTTGRVPFAASLTPMPPLSLLDPLFLWKKLLYLYSPAWRARQIIPEWTFFSEIGVKRLRRQFSRVSFRAVFAHRLYTLPYASIAPERPVILDLDDWESVTRSRLAELAGLLGRGALRAELDRESLQYEKYEQTALGAVQQVLLCSQSDAAALSCRYDGSRFRVLPNIVKPPRDSLPRNADRKELLFVGSFGYLPNWDAAVQATHVLLPQLPDCRLILVGRQASNLPAEIRHHPRVEVHDSVTDLKPFYQRATLVLVPIRAGGGTRIKILEAMAHGCPVVSSVVGAEGLEVEQGREILIGRDSLEMVEHCRTILDDSGFGAALAERAEAAVRARYSFSSWRPIFQGLVQSLD